MSEPVKLPAEPTVADLARGISQNHACLEAARTEIRQTNNALILLQNRIEPLVALILWWQAFWKGWVGVVIKWGFPAVILIIVSAYVNLWVTQQAVLRNSEQAVSQAQAAKQTATTSQAIIVQKLHSLGAQ